MLRARGEGMQFGSPVAVGRAVEDYTSASVIDGLGASEALRHAMIALDAHEAVEWDRDNDQQRLDLHRDILATIALHAGTGVREALAGANQVTGQERLEKSYSGLHLPFLGFSDFQGGGRVAELKVKTSPVSATAKSGRRAGGVAIQAGREARPASRLLRRRPRLPGQPDLRVGNRLRLFNETNCQELTPEGIQRGVRELRARAWSRENVMRRAPDYRTLMQMHGPDWSDWGWRMDPSHLAEAREVWGLAA